MPAIKIGGSKPAVKKTTARTVPKAAVKAAKAAGKPVPAKVTTKKPATAATKAGAKAAPKAAPKKAAAPRAPRTPKTDPKIIARFEKALTTAGAKRAKTLEAHEAAVDEMAAIVSEAIEAEVPMSVISTSTGVSRQWLYKISQFRGRNGTPKKTPGRKPAAAKAQTAAALPRKQATTTKAVAKTATKVNTGTAKPRARTAIKIK